MAVVVGTDNSELINAADGVTEGIDTIFGWGGNDIIYGLNGDDTIIGGAGADQLNGGAGKDWASYYGSTAGVTASLATGTGDGGDAEGDTLALFENLEGSAHADTLVGDGYDNTLYGSGGGDTLKGGGGADTLLGGSGNDMLKGGGGADVLNGGAGSDTIAYNESAVGVKVSLAIGMYNPGKDGDAQGDTFISIENLIGSNHNDTLVGTVGDNVIRGLDGQDFIHGLAGNDTLWGGAGDDHFFGGYDDDTLYGENGNDLLEGHLGSDHLDGGAGNDKANYTQSNAGVTVSLETGAASGGHAQGDSFESIEGIYGSVYSDTLGGNAGDNLLDGGLSDAGDILAGYAGKDELWGHGGNDFLSGGSDDDTLIGGDGDDVLDAGAGGDYLRGDEGNDIYYVDDVLDWVVETGANQFDTVVTSTTYSLDAGCNIELFKTADDSGTVAIDLTGNDASQEIRGNAGDNMITGGFGTDILVGLGGADTFVFNSVLGANNIDTIVDYSVAEDQIHLDKATFSSLATGANSTLSSGEFAIGAATDESDRIIYDSATGALYYDADGTGAAAAVQFATLSTGLVLTNDDFFIT